MTSPAPPEPSAELPTPVGSSLRHTRRNQTGSVVTLVGALVVVGSSFFPWLQVSQSNDATIGALTTLIGSYIPWALPDHLLFPILVWFPLPFVAWALVHAWRHPPTPQLPWPSPRLALVVLCVLGLLGAFAFAVLESLRLVPIRLAFHPQAFVTTADFSLGWWLCVAGYGILVLGVLLLGPPRLRLDEGIAARTRGHRSPHSPQDPQDSLSPDVH